MELLFVYNADSGRPAKLMDGVHKVLSPGTYACNLCSLTHGAFFERRIWKEFRESSELPMRFLYKDQFAHQYPRQAAVNKELPIVYTILDSELEVLLSSEEVKDIPDALALILRIKSRLAKH